MLASTKTVDLFEVIANKDNRVKRQEEWLKSHSLPLISFSINMPGPEKNNALTDVIFRQGMHAIRNTCASYGWTIVNRQIHRANTGAEAIMVVDIDDVNALKIAMMRIEHTHAMGRLMDIDVLAVSGEIISRDNQGFGKRQCYICDDEAVVCARSQRHDLPTLLQKIEEIVNNA